MTISEFQKSIEKIYLERDSARGLGGTFMWFVEEVGELATALRQNDREQLEGEFADVFAWLVSLASIAGVDMTKAVEKYGQGCPRCHAAPCHCSKKT
ncbi:MAG TPA: MazG nucleotide pyrophosphohydrolase domain-containing protein [Planctomycetota bacterium]|nr:MazG nucleotide pyrophosphohydrolase domain-containing protein [Planctomycetota bacterium]